MESLVGQPFADIDESIELREQLQNWRQPPGQGDHFPRQQNSNIAPELNLSAQEGEQ